MKRDFDLIDSETLKDFELVLEEVLSDLDRAIKHDSDVHCDDFFNEVLELYNALICYKCHLFKFKTKC